jgi:hypothetical protein
MKQGTISRLDSDGHPAMVKSLAPLLITLCLASAACSPPSVAFGCDDRPVMTTTDPDGNTTELFIPDDRLNKAPRWMPGQGEPPLPVSKAISIAQAWAGKAYSRFDSVRINEVTLARAGCGEGQWYYRLDFSPVVDGNVLYGSGYWVAVLMDGTVVPTKKSKKNPQ